jgi:HSP20 family protein
MSRDLIRLMQSLFLPALSERRPAGWCPAADVYRTGDGWVIKLEVAGVRPEDLRIEVCGNRLTVRGRRRDTSPCQGWRPHLMEIPYSDFSRSFELATDLNPGSISTDYFEGMLHIEIRTETEA